MSNPADKTHGVPPRHLDDRGPAVSAEPPAIACSTPYEYRSPVEPFGPGSRVIGRRKQHADFAGGGVEQGRVLADGTE
jgi:hypothetical protein